MKRLCLYLPCLVLLCAALPGCSNMQKTSRAADTADTPVLQPAVPVAENPDHEALLRSADPQLAANKRLVYDMWRSLVDARDGEAAKKYLDKDYIQHNPNADTGLDGVLAYFSRLGEPLPIPDRIQGKLVAIVAERDLVVLAWVDEQDHPAGEGRKYTTTWFDMYRIDGGMIVEHWDHGTIAEGGMVRGYVPPRENPDHRSSIASRDRRLQANKQLVYDMWRTLLDAQQVEEAPRYLAEDYIQHNPMANTGLQGFLTFFRRIAQPRPVQPQVAGFMEIVAENDLVVLATLRTYLTPGGEPYNTTWFDMFRIRDGMLVEHWDTAKFGLPRRAASGG